MMDPATRLQKAAARRMAEEAFDKADNIARKILTDHTEWLAPDAPIDLFAGVIANAIIAGVFPLNGEPGIPKETP